MGPVAAEWIDREEERKEAEDTNTYKVISSHDNEHMDLYGEISKLMRQGWKCQGGVSMTRYSYKENGSRHEVWVYTQAMIRDRVDYGTTT